MAEYINKTELINYLDEKMLWTKRSWEDITSVIDELPTRSVNVVGDNVMKKYKIELYNDILDEKAIKEFDVICDDITEAKFIGRAVVEWSKLKYEKELFYSVIETEA